MLDLDPLPGTEVYARLVFLSVLAEVYEGKHRSVEKRSLRQAVPFAREQTRMDRSRMNELWGNCRVPEFLAESVPSRSARYAPDVITSASRRTC